MDIFAPFANRRKPLPIEDRGLILTCGLPRAGKSVWARQQGFPIVNPDSVRLQLYGKPFLKMWEPAVWWLSRFMVDALFRAGHEYVILDATNTTVMRRAQWAKWGYDVYVHEIATPAEVCRQRAKDTGQDYLMPIITAMAAKYEHPSAKEPRIRIWPNSAIDR